MTMQIPIFVVACTGRCGSTVMSEMLELHPQVLSLSEFLVPLMLSGVQHAGQVMTAKQFCTVLQTRMPTTSALLRAGIMLPEFRYQFQRKGARYSTESGLPFPHNAALSHLTDDPDNAFDRLMEKILAADGACVRDHLSILFRTLTEMFGGSVIVERSGGSLFFMSQIRALLPEASVILLTRRGVDTALSMSRHAYFKHFALRSVLKTRLGYDPYISSRRDGIETLSAMLSSQLPENFTKAGFEAFDLPLSVYGSIWAAQMERGLSALPERFHYLSYEGLCSDPALQMRALAEYIGVTSDLKWIDAATNKIRPQQRTPRDFQEYELESLRDACKPGENALRLKGII